MARKKARICRTGAARRTGIIAKGQVIDMLLTEYNAAEVRDAVARNEHRLGRVEGENRLAALISAMAKGSDAAYIAKVSDPAFREEMYEKYGIK